MRRTGFIGNSITPLTGIQQGEAQSFSTQGLANQYVAGEQQRMAQEQFRAAEERKKEELFSRELARIMAAKNGIIKYKNTFQNAIKDLDGYVVKYGKEIMNPSRDNLDILTGFEERKQKIMDIVAIDKYETSKIREIGAGLRSGKLKLRKGAVDHFYRATTDENTPLNESMLERSITSEDLIKNIQPIRSEQAVIDNKTYRPFGKVGVLYPLDKEKMENNLAIRIVSEPSSDEAIAYKQFVEDNKISDPANPFYIKQFSKQVVDQFKDTEKPQLIDDNQLERERLAFAKSEAAYRRQRDEKNDNKNKIEFVTQDELDINIKTPNINKDGGEFAGYSGGNETHVIKMTNAVVPAAGSKPLKLRLTGQGGINPSTGFVERSTEARDYIFSAKGYLPTTKDGQIATPNYKGEVTNKEWVALSLEEPQYDMDGRQISAKQSKTIYKPYEELSSQLKAKIEPYLTVNGGSSYTRATKPKSVGGTAR